MGRRNEEEMFRLHGIGPKALAQLRRARCRRAEPKEAGMRTFAVRAAVRSRGGCAPALRPHSRYEAELCFIEVETRLALLISSRIGTSKKSGTSLLLASPTEADTFTL